MKKITMIFISVFLLISAIPVKAEKSWRTGTIKRTISDDTSYGGCMVFLSVKIGNDGNNGEPVMNCPENGWVSLDCKGIYFQESAGSRNYASAIVAASINKQVSVYVDDTKKSNGYCVAQRLDVLY